MCCRILVVVRILSAIFGIFGLAYGITNLFLVCRELETTTGVTMAGVWDVIYYHPAGQLSFLYTIAAAMIILGALINAWALFPPFLFMTTLMIVHVLTYEVLTMTKLGEKQLAAASLMSAAVVAVSAIAFVVLSLYYLVCGVRRKCESVRCIRETRVGRMCLDCTGGETRQRGKRTARYDDKATSVATDDFDFFHVRQLRTSDDEVSLLYCPMRRRDADNEQTSLPADFQTMGNPECLVKACVPRSHHQQRPWWPIYNPSSQLHCHNPHETTEKRVETIFLQHSQSGGGDQLPQMNRQIEMVDEVCDSSELSLRRLQMAARVPHKETYPLSLTPSAPPLEPDPYMDHDLFSKDPSKLFPSRFNVSSV